MSEAIGWVTAQIADWPIEIIDGDRSSNYPKEGDFVPVGVPFLNTTNIRDGALDLSDARFITQAKWDSIKKGRAQPKDILMTTRGTIGRIARFKCEYSTALINAQMLILRADPAVLDPDFLFYVLSTDDVQATLRSFSSGSAQPQIPIRDLKRVPISLPPIEIQRRIVAILGAYDDLIEINRRRIAILEEMARGLFSEWFIRLHFPGHEDGAIEDTPDGPLPVGWSWGTAGDLLLFDPRTRVPREGEKPFIPMGHLGTATSLIAEPEARTGNSGAKFQNGDTLFARITPCLENGKTGLVRNLPGPDGVGFGSTEFIVMRGGRVGPAFSYCLSRLPAFREHARMSMSGASGRQRARTANVADFSIAIPPVNNLFEGFEKAAWPMLELVGQIGLTSERLAAARDLLLPRLTSGQLSITLADRELEAA